MASSGKKRTTMSKINREIRLRDKRAEKAVRKSARKLGDAHRTADLSTRVAVPEDVTIESEAA